MAQTPVQDIAETAGPRRRFDPYIWGAALFFVAAAGLAAVPALRAGPATLAGLLLLGGVAGVAILGLVAIRASAQHESDSDAAEGFIDALSEPTALVVADGRLLAANAAWRQVMGEARRLPKGVSGSGLFAALVRARKGEMAEGLLRADGADRVATVSRLAGGRLLVRLAPPVAAPTIAAELPSAPKAEAVVPPPGSLDAFSGASPFGAALLEGLDPFNSRILEANPALTAMAGPGAKAGVMFGELIEPVTRTEAET
ncbi:MAG: hybrid sensor histidine kinase/response regulator, partial [Alphaproteobacteria bacterium]|nr:hybrid sensor histidine kinase/response regulator [Alphaproteobacteria bacterium]